MSLKIVISKGYTLEITSWENDGDYYKTTYKTVETLEEAEMIFKICYELFRSKNSDGNGVGNSMDRREIGTVEDYYNENKDLLVFEPFIDLKQRIDADTTFSSDDLIFDCFAEIAYELMGSSEYYDFRVCESCSVTYSPEDIYLEEIKF